MSSPARCWKRCKAGDVYREILILTVVNHPQNPDHAVSVVDPSPTDRHVEHSFSIRTFTAFALRTSSCAFIEGHRGRWRLGRPVNRRRERDANLDGLMTSQPGLQRFYACSDRRGCCSDTVAAPLPVRVHPAVHLHRAEGSSSTRRLQVPCSVGNSNRNAAWPAALPRSRRRLERERADGLGRPGADL